MMPIYIIKYIKLLHEVLNIVTNFTFFYQKQNFWAFIIILGVTMKAVIFES